MKALFAADAMEFAAVSSASQPQTSPISHINPNTGLSSDFLNHFTEAVMALDMAASMPDCLDDLRTWRPKSYREHFASSRLTDRDAVIAAYDAADPGVRNALDCAAETLNTVLVETRDVVLAHLSTPDAEAVARRAVVWLRPLIARTAAIINGIDSGRGDGAGMQAAVDALFDR